MGFDADATFGAATPDVGGDMGTPVPDFSPDTGIPQDVAPVAAKTKGGGLKTALLAVVLLIVGLAAGLFASPFARDFIPVIPNPDAAEIERLEGDVAPDFRVSDRQNQHSRSTGHQSGGYRRTHSTPRRIAGRDYEHSISVRRGGPAAGTASYRTWKISTSTSRLRAASS
jgi:hypothetical protein